MTSVPKTMRAVIIADEGKKVVLKEIPVPKLDDNDVLIKVEYASQNPTDWKHAFGIGNPKSITGCDLSGTIVSLGSNLNTARKIGDKVAFAVHGGLFPDKGAFAEYARAESDLVFEVPENLSMEGASNFGVPWVTALQAIADSQGHVWPPKETETGKWYLIYGASSSVGLFAIQVAKLYGYKIIAVCSPHNFDLVKSYGADEVVDYKNPEACSTRIKEISGGGVSIGLDTISEGTSFEIAMKGYADKGGRLNAILPPKDEHRQIREDVEIVSTLMYTLFGKPFVFAGMNIPASEHDHEFGRAIAKHSTEVIKTHNIKPNPLKQMGGLEDIEAGLKHMQQGKVSGEKLVYKIAH